VVVTPNGKGALYDTNLSPRAGVRYWFWVSGASESIPVGSVDAEPGNGFLFTVHGTMTGALLSAEPAAATHPSAPTTIVGRGQLR
jgi:hypothetical protein